MIGMHKKLLITASSFAHIRSFHLPYLQEFRRRGWEVHVACGGQPEDIPGADRVFSLPLEKNYFSPRNFRASAQLRKILREQGYSRVITHTALASFFTRLAEAGLRNRPFTVNVVHGYLFGPNVSRLRSLILAAAEYLVLPQTDLILTMNRWDTRWTKAHFPHTALMLIPGMGVDIPCRQGSDHPGFGFEDRDFVLVYAAEFSSRKNQTMLIRSMKHLPGNVKLVLPGSGSMLDDCRHLARTLGVEDRVLFPGQLSNVISVLMASNAAVSASRSEGLPFNIMEAMCMGIPIVASDVKGNQDLIREGVNGFLFPYNDEEAFTSAVRKLLVDPALCHRLGAAGSQLAAPYRLENVLSSVMDAYLHEP